MYVDLCVLVVYMFRIVSVLYILALLHQSGCLEPVPKVEVITYLICAVVLPLVVFDSARHLQLQYWWCSTCVDDKDVSACWESSLQLLMCFCRRESSRRTSTSLAILPSSMVLRIWLS